MSSTGRHVSRERLPADRGRAFGRAQRDRVRRTVEVYARILAEDRGLGADAVCERGRRVERAVRSYRPALCEELEGIAVGAGVEPELLYAVNARTEILSGGQLAGAIGGECSTVGVVDADGSRGVLGQTWDFHPALRPCRMLWTCVFPDGSSLTTMTEAGMLAKVGTNSHGLALTMNFLSTDLDGGDDGVPVHVLARTVLEEAATVAEARRLIEDASANGSACLTVAGSNDAGVVEIVAFERWPGGVGSLPVSPETRTLVHTNHFVTPISARDLLRDGRSGPSTELRYERLRTALADGLAPDVPAVGGVLSAESPDKHASIFQREDDAVPWLERCATLATLAVEVPSGTLWYRGEDDPQMPLQQIAAPLGAADAIS